MLGYNSADSGFLAATIQGYIIFKKAAWGGGIIFVPSAKNGEDYLYLEILLQILIKSKILLNIFGQILHFCAQIFFNIGRNNRTFKSVLGKNIRTT